VTARLPHEEEILELIRPTEDERRHIGEIAAEVLAAIARSGRAEGMVVGSVARHTWVKGDKDLDVFMLFAPSLTREELEREGMGLARGIATSFSDRFYEKYAEHPYINAIISDVDVDLVPCYRVASAAQIQSAVDRTPFHTRYITGRIDGLVDDVLLLKRFAKAGGVYGSDQMTEGFSGYLCELLILHYGGFSALIRGAAEWRPHHFIDPERHAAKKFEEPLVVIDPVDPKRNVAAAVSLDRMMEFVELARGYSRAPSEEFFRLRAPHPMERVELATLLAGRGTRLAALTCETPPYIPDVVVPQLKRSVQAVSELLERNGFVVHHAHYEMGQCRSMLLFEFLVWELPPIRHHMGPPLWNPENAEKFREKYANSELPGPFILDGKYGIETRREFTSAAALLASPALLQAGLGKHIRQSFEKGWSVHEGTECWDEEFAVFLAQFFGRSSPLTRIGRNGGE
jgi:tRNA nucleotidyltransferase (CCA-adding enzyme)